MREKHRGRKRMREKKEEVVSRLERSRQPLGFYSRDIHLLCEFICCSIYYSSVCFLTGILVLLTSSGTCPS